MSTVAPEETKQDAAAPPAEEKAQDASDLFGGLKKKSGKKKKIPVNFDLDEVRLATARVGADPSQKPAEAAPQSPAGGDEESAPQVEPATDDAALAKDEVPAVSDEAPLDVRGGERLAQRADRASLAR